MFGNPHILKNLLPSDIRPFIERLKAAGWVEGVLGQGSHEGLGFSLREVNSAGDLTGRVIFRHPGGGHHGEKAYWKVCSSKGGPVRVFDD